MKKLSLKQNYFFKLLLLSCLVVFSKTANAQCNPEFLYDKVISGYHSSIALDTNGHYLVWGQDIANNGTSDVLAPQALNSTNYSALTSAVLKATIGGDGGGGNDQFIALTSGGLYAWGTQGYVFSKTLTTGTTLAHVGTITGGDATTSLPTGVAASSVTMMFATDSTLALVTSDGSVWVITQGAASMQGDNSALSATTWHKVKINSTTYLSNVTAVRGQYSNRSNGALMALTSTGQVYTWGPGIYKGDGSARTSSAYATPMTLPAEFSSSNVPKLIAVTGGQGNSFTCFNTYYLLSKTTGVIYTLGDNTVHQCGDFTNTERKSWAAVHHSSTASDTLKSMSFISVMDHNGAAADPGVIAIGDTGNIYTFGYNNKSMLGQNATYTTVDPSIPRGFTPGTDKGLFAEVGGHTGVYLKQGSYNFCYCGHFVDGSAGNNTTANDVDSVFDCSSTPLVGLCGAVPVVPSLATSTIAATPTSIAADSVATSTVTVQLKTAGGVNLTKSGGSVVITTTSGHLGTVTDNNDGTYTATLTSSHTAGTAVLGFSLLGVASTNTTSVTYTAVAASTATSVISASPNSILADGSSTSIITVQLKDAGGTNLTGSGGTVTMSTSAGTLGTVTDNANGTYTVTLTSANTASTATLSFSINGVAATNTATVTFTGVIGNTGTSTITADPTSITADGISTSTITVQLEDAGGTNITASAGTITVSTDNGTLGTVTDNADGTYSVTLTSANTVSTATLSFSINGVAATNTATVNFTAIVASPVTSTISASPTTIAADGSSTSIVTVQLETAGGTNINSSDGTVVITTDQGSVGSTTDNGDGTYSATLTSGNTAAMATLSFSLNGTPATNTTTVNFTPWASPINSTISANPTSIAADGSSTSTITVQLENAVGTNLAVSAGTITVSTDNGTIGTVTDNADGTYSVTLTSGNTATTATLSFSINGVAATNTTTVNFTPWGSPINSTISANPTSIAADGSSTSTITVQLENAVGTNLAVSAGTVTVSTDNGTLGTVTNNADGTYSVTLTSGNDAATATLSFSINGVAATNTTTVNFTPWASPITSTISAIPTSIPADGSSTSTLTVQLENAVGANLAVSAGTVTVSTDNGTLGTVTDNADGTYSVTLTSANTVSTATLSFSINGIAATNTATVNFTACSPVIGFNPDNQTACSGGNAIFAITATGASLNYHWQENAGAGYVNLTDGGVYSGVLTNTLTLTGVTTSMNTYSYRCVVSNSCNPSTPSDGGILTVNNLPSSTGATNGGMICVGGTAALHANSSDASAWSWTGPGGYTSSLNNPTPTPTVTTTYSLTLSSVGNGCQPTTVYTTSVTVNNVPVSTGATNAGAICVGGTAALHANSSYATAWSWTGPGGYTSSLNNPTPTPTVTSTYSVTLSSVGSGCQPATVYTTTVTVKNVPTSSGVTNSGTICIGGTEILASNSSAATAWSWIGSNGFTSSAQNPVFTPTVTATYSLTVSSAGSGCQPETVYTTSVTVNNVPASSGVTNSGPICKGGTVTLSANTNSSTNTWIWIGSDGFASVSENPTATPTVTTTYTLLVGGTGSGCHPTATYTSTVIVNNVPVSTGATNGGAICVGGTAALFANSTYATAWSWHGSDGYTSSVQNPTPSPTVTTTYSLTISSTGSGCNPATVYTTSVTVKNVPSAEPSASAGVICNGATITLSSNSSDATTWSWIGSDGFSSTAANPTASPTTSTTYSLTVSSTGSGCSPETIYTTSVTVNNLPTSTGATNGGAICKGGTAALFANSSYATSWSWSGPAGYSSSLQNPAPTPTVTSTYSLTLSSVGYGCNPGAVYLTTVTVKNVPSSTGATNGGAICAGGTATLNSNSSSATAWSWHGSDGFSSALQNPTATPTVTTTYSLTLSSVGSGCQPETIYTTSVTVNNVPTSSGPTNNGPTCSSGTVTLNSNSSYASTWFWVGTDGFVSTSANPTDNPTTTTVYTLLVGGTGSGCHPGTTYTTTVIVNNVPSSTGPTNSSPICVGGTVTLNPNSSDATSWSWMGSDGSASSLSNPTATPTVTTTYSLTVSSVGDGCQPETIYTTSVTVNNVPSSTGPSNNGAICTGATATLTPNTSDATAWVWTGPDGYTTTEENPMVTPPLTTTYSLTISSTGSGCNPDSVYTTTVVVNPLPVLISGAGAICAGGTLNLTHDGDGTWSSGNVATATIDPLTGVATGVSMGTATITYTLPTGCITSTVMTVNQQPATPMITTATPPTLCSSTYFQNFGTDVAPTADEYYSWSATNGDIMATGHNSQYSIVNFSTPGAAIVTLTATLNETHCTSSTQYLVNVDGTLTDNPLIIYAGGQFICLLNNVSHYQWGYDDAYTLDSTMIDGQINQSYFLDSPDFANKYYWAMTTDLTTGCVKKGYYRVPTGVTNINEVVAAEIKVFPNPAQAYVYVDIVTKAEGNKEIEVINLLGQKVATITAINNKVTIDVSGFAAGYYFVKCYNNGINIGTAKFIKN